MTDQLPFKLKQKVWVFDLGFTYEAIIIEKKNSKDQYLIHYERWGKQFDVWKNEDLIAKRTENGRKLLLKNEKKRKDEEMNEEGEEEETANDDDGRDRYEGSKDEDIFYCKPVGSPVNPLEINQDKYYLEMKVDRKVNYRIGDCVRTNQKRVDESPYEDSICQIISIYEDFKTKTGVWIEARFFKRPSELTEKQIRT